MLVVKHKQCKSCARIGSLTKQRLGKFKYLGSQKRVPTFSNLETYHLSIFWEELRKKKVSYEKLAEAGGGHTPQLAPLCVASSLRGGPPQTPPRTAIREYVSDTPL